MDKPAVTPGKGAPAPKADASSGTPGPKRLAAAERRALSAALTEEESFAMMIAQRKLRLETMRTAAARQYYIAGGFEEFRKKFDVFFKYNPLPPGAMNEALMLMAESEIDFGELSNLLDIHAAEADGARTPMETHEYYAENRKLLDENKARRLEALAGLMGEEMANKLTHLADSRTLRPGLFDTWAAVGQFASYMADNSAPLASQQVNALLDTLGNVEAGVEAFAAKQRAVREKQGGQYSVAQTLAAMASGPNPGDEAARGIVSALLTPEQQAQYENYLREEALLARIKAADRELERQGSALQTGKNAK